MSVASEDGVLKPPPGTVVKTGYLRKLKTMKKKYFVLRTDPSNMSAPWLEYYDSEKKFKNNHCPKRCISLKTCYVINRRTETKHKYVLGLYRRLDCFSIVFECEDDLLEWLRVLLSCLHGEEVSTDVVPKPYYGHAWRVVVQKKELANCHNLWGSFLLCLSETTLKLLKPSMDEDGEPTVYELLLQCIRRCGNLDAFFYMELGQASCFGAGNLWMQAEDASTAHHMHSVIMNACTNIPKKELMPKSRCRSSSANESSKPIYFNGRKWASSGDDSIPLIMHSRSHNHQEQSLNATSPLVFSHTVLCDGLHPHSFISYPPIRRASTGTRPVTVTSTTSTTTSSTISLSSGKVNTSYVGRERCDSLPTRHRSSFDNGVIIPRYVPSYVSCAVHNARSNNNCSVYSRAQVFSPPNSSLNVTSVNSTNDNDCYVESENYARYMYSLSPDGPIIPEENNEEYTQWGGVNNNYNNESVIQNAVHCSSCPCYKKCMGDSSSSTNSNIMCHSVINNNRSSYRSNSQTSCSSCGSSPMDSGVMYLAASQGSIGDVRNDNCSNKSPESINHSRESSIHEENYEDGYMTMAPRSADTGYNSIENNIRHQCDISSGTSSCSITSGTPSTDAGLSEYHLDKVSACFTPSDEEIVFNVRPVRAYSTGSKPEVHRNKWHRYDYDGLRVRAFSVGSHNLHQTNTASPTFVVPAAFPIRTCNSASASSVEPCDMVEIDFSANKHRKRSSHLRGAGGAAAGSNTGSSRRNSGTLSNYPLEKLAVLSHHSSGSSLSGCVVDVSPKSSAKLTNTNVYETTGGGGGPYACSCEAAVVPGSGKQLLGERSPKASATAAGSSGKCCVASYNVARASPPSAASSYLSPTLERVIETSPFKNRCTCRNQQQPSSTIESAAGYAEGEAYMDMKPGEYKLDSQLVADGPGYLCSTPKNTVSPNNNAASLNNNASSNVCSACTCSPMAVMRDDCPIIGKQNIVFVPRLSSVQRSDGKIEYLDMSFGSCKQSEDVTDGVASGDVISTEFPQLVANNNNNNNIISDTVIDTGVTDTIVDIATAKTITATVIANEIDGGIVDADNEKEYNVESVDGEIDLDFVDKDLEEPTQCDNNDAEEGLTDDLCSSSSSSSRQCSKPIAIQYTNGAANGTGKRSNSMGASMFFKRRSSCAHPSHQKMSSFLPLNISLPSSFASLGRKNKKANSAKKGKSTALDTSLGGSSGTGVCNNVNNTTSNAGTVTNTGSNCNVFTVLSVTSSSQTSKSTSPIRQQLQPLSAASSCKCCTPQAFNNSNNNNNDNNNDNNSVSKSSNKSVGTDAILELCNCRCGLAYESCMEYHACNPEQGIYPVILPAVAVHVPKLQRKISEPSSVVGKSNMKIRNAIKQDSLHNSNNNDVVNSSCHKNKTTTVPINPKKILLRSTSVPDGVSSGSSKANVENNSGVSQLLRHQVVSAKQSTDDNDSCYVSFAPSNCKTSENGDDNVTYATLESEANRKNGRLAVDAYEFSPSSTCMMTCQHDGEYAQISFKKKF